MKGDLPKKRHISVPFLLLLTLAVLMIVLFPAGYIMSEKVSPSESITLRIAIPYSDTVQDPDSNYYVKWLAERTGLSLEFTLIRQNRSEEYLDALFSSDADIDIVLFGADFAIKEAALKPYAESSDVYTDADGRFYYANYGSRPRDGAGQILWINYEWLNALSLSIPSDTEEFRDILTAFRDKDPNGNGKRDEIPLLGTDRDYAFSPAEFLLNAYVYNDPVRSRFDPEGSHQNAVTDSFREGLAYCAGLYAEGLLDPRTYQYSVKELSELVNSPVGLIGTFTTDTISDVIYQANPEIMARYMHVPPLMGPDGRQYAYYAEDTASVGAIITGRSNRKEAAANLLSLMESEEASLIARFGEEGVDWERSRGADVSIYGGVSTVVTKNYLWNTSQNKHLNGIGPMNVPEKYLKGVTWNGINSDAEYIDGRAQSAYREYLPREIPSQEKNVPLSDCMDAWIRDFVTGKKDIRSDEEWEKYTKELARYY